MVVPRWIYHTMNLLQYEITHYEFTARSIFLTMKLPTMNLPHSEITNDKFSTRWNYHEEISDLIREQTNKR